MTALALRRFAPPFKLTVAASVVAWTIAWFTEAPLSDWLAFTVLGLERGSHLGEAVAFFLLDVPKVLLLLLGIITAVTLIRDSSRPSVSGPRSRAGARSPAASRPPPSGSSRPSAACSAVPLFIGFVEAGIPLGVTFAFLIS